MLSWKEIVQGYLIKHSNQIKRVTQPLKDIFEITYFTYHRIDNKGKYTVLLDRPDWAEHYVSERIYLNDPYMRHPDVYSSGACLVCTHGSLEYRKKVLRAGKEYLNCDEGLLLIEKSPEYVEFFGFAGERAKCNLSLLYLNHQPLLKSFAEHFKAELHHLLYKQSLEGLLLSVEKKEDYFNSEQIAPKIHLKQQERFLRALKMDHHIRSFKQLTAQEKACARLLLQSLTARESGEKLLLSPRTVESYLNNAKNKLGCCTKKEFLENLRQLSELDLL
ncbi:MAG: LuxR C-terminal-related transcriptional regulator [Parachlamydiales bacterium]|jgi:DNA-binding CsgD family transcriptional regulator